MGVRSTNTGTPSNPKGLNTRIDGHLLEYFRQNFSAGGGGTNFVPPPPPFTATGGTKVTSGDYTYHIFTSTQTFSVDPESGPATVDYVIIGGGGAGGNAPNTGLYGAAGGGGAGGFETGTAALNSSTATTTMTVGGGGAGGSGPYPGKTGRTGNVGTDSTAPLFSVTSGGGGGGRC